MRTWLALLGGLLLWSAHFFGLYLIAEFGSDEGLIRLGAAGLTLACVAASVVLASWLRRQAGWIRGTGLAGVLIALVAILWQALPLLLV